MASDGAVGVDAVRADEVRDDAVREEARTWLEEHWHPERPLVEWRHLLADSGWGTPSWPLEWHGRGLPPSMDAVVAREFDAVGAVGAAAGIAMYLVAPTLLAHADADQKRRHLRPILTGEHRWCQLFSEPTNGSDLAGLVTRADRDGDEWIVNGQKVWNSGAHRARFGILLARTDWEAPKHRGISFFLLPMEQPGVEVRPLRQMNGHATFNEVFFRDARVPAGELVGSAGDGWRIALTTLAHERSAVATRRPRYRADGGPTVQQAKQESDEYFATYRWYPQRAGRANLVVPEAVRTGRVSDPLVRQQIARVEALRRISSWTIRRARDARAAGKPPGPEGSLTKLNMSVTARACHAAHSMIAGSMGMLVGAGSNANGVVSEVLMSTPAMSIAGGTDEIQRNIIGERVLGLSKEPDETKDIPYKHARRN
ncbi:acyl-CoA dehydrogenase family protein [Candidatus Poriferisodalis sp.]|uniref:acyl-CoA dehydrogenase family protein n=1 Tax=Candidatus Poriferisodalis sp. TaxID=3101277 RepID=UPI003B022694